MGENLIRIDYEDTVRKANEMSGHSFVLRYQVYKLRLLKDSIKRNWDSPASKVFIAKLEKQIEDLDVSAKKMKRTSDLIENVAKRIYQTDLDVEENIKQL